MAAFLAFEPSRVKLYFYNSVRHILDVLPLAAPQDNRFVRFEDTQEDEKRK